MQVDVTVRIDPSASFDYRVDISPDANTQASARDWLERNYLEFGCEPSRPTGKVLLRDKILAVASAAGAQKFAEDTAWAQAYARAVALSLDRIMVRVDVEARTVS